MQLLTVWLINLIIWKRAQAVIIVQLESFKVMMFWLLPLFKFRHFVTEQNVKERQKAEVKFQNVRIQMDYNPAFRKDSGTPSHAFQKLENIFNATC